MKLRLEDHRGTTVRHPSTKSREEAVCREPGHDLKISSWAQIINGLLSMGKQVPVP